ncbi:MAG: glycosyltransferase [Acidimicrobiia bacterium]
MIAFAACIASRDKYERFALPGIKRYGGDDALVIETSSSSSILEAYNGVLDQLRERSDIEALVLLHEDTEIRDPLFRWRVRRAFNDPDVAVVGAIGATDVNSLAWWEGNTFGWISESRGQIEFGRGDAVVDAVDGLMLVLSPWAIRNLRFDDKTFRGFHAYDIDFCFQARKAGRQVKVVDLDLIHHTKGGYGDETVWQANNAAWSAKWQPFIDSQKRTGPQCSIIIPLYNKVEYTHRCLESIIANTPEGSYQTVLVDNGSSDDTGRLLDAIEGDDVVIIRNEVNQGFAKACNAGARAATTDTLLFLNNDTTVTPGWLEPMLANLRARPNVGVVGNKLLFPDGTIQHGGVMLFEYLERPNDHPVVSFGPMLRYYRQPGDLALANRPEIVNGITGACMLIRRHLFFSLGGFDEVFWNGYEDVDLSIKVHRAGWDLFYEPRSVVYHYESVSGPERFSKERANVDLFVNRWRGRVIPEIVASDTVAYPNRIGFTGDRLPGQSVVEREQVVTAAYLDLRERVLAALAAAARTSP